MPDELKTFIGEKMGEATMCWQPIPDGTFDSERAVKILDEIYQAIEKQYHSSKLERPVRPTPNPTAKIPRSL